MTTPFFVGIAIKHSMRDRLRELSRSFPRRKKWAIEDGKPYDSVRKQCTKEALLIRRVLRQNDWRDFERAASELQGVGNGL